MNKKRAISLELHTHESFSDAEDFERKELRNMTGQERFLRALSLMSMYYEATPRLERLYRVVEREDMPISDDWRVGI